MIGKVTSISLSVKKGMPRCFLENGNFIKGMGLEGDSHSSKPNRNVSIVAEETLESMKNAGIDGFCTRRFTANITTKGIKLHEGGIGSKIKIGNSLHEITYIGKECHINCNAFEKSGDCSIPKEVVFTKVIESGTVRIDDIVEQY